MSAPTYAIAKDEVINKYQVAGEITARVLANVKKLCVSGAKIIDICEEGDKQILEATAKIYKGKKVQKGIAFPTAISPNSVVAHLSPLATDPEAAIELKAGDVVKITLGTHIDGYASVSGDTIVVEGGEISGEVADTILAGWYASEAAIRTIKPGKKNWDVTKVVQEVTGAYGCTALEGMLSHEQSQNTIDGKKRIILNPADTQKKDFETITFEEGDVWGLDILVTSGQGKTSTKETATSIYKRADITYQLRLKTSRMVFSEVQKKAGLFPFTIRTLDDAKKARLGLQECIKNNLVVPYEVYYDRDGKPVVQFFSTIALTKNGTVKFAGPTEPDFTSIKSDKKITDEKILELLAQPLKPKKKPAAKTEAKTEV